MWWRRSATCSRKPRQPRSSSPATRHRGFVGRLMRVHGTSMLPALRPGDVVFVQASAFRHRAPHRGEVVVARPSSLGGRALVKRIVGTPRPDEYFLLGDHPADSLDSRTLGPVTRQELIGRVWLRVWPPRVLALDRVLSRAGQP